MGCNSGKSYRGTFYSLCDRSEGKNRRVKSDAKYFKFVYGRFEKFVIHFRELYGDKKEAFVEEEGKKYFLLYLRPIINGTGNYYIEAQTRDLRRTDIIVDYHGEQSIIEMKIWHGEEYHRRGELQLMGYLDDYHVNVGYMVSFNFNQKKECGVKEIISGEKKIIEAVI